MEIQIEKTNCSGEFFIGAMWQYNTRPSKLLKLFKNGRICIVCEDRVDPEYQLKHLNVSFSENSAYALNE